MNVIDFLRDVGKNFRLGTMLSKDIVARRLNSEEGISFTEFSYQVLQGNDYLHLYDNFDCVLELGGSDQWGNLTSGLDLIHKVRGVNVNVMASPIITDANGKKFGKSEGNAVWLDPTMLSPYRFYQSGSTARTPRWKACSRPSRSCRNRRLNASWRAPPRIQAPARPSVCSHGRSRASCTARMPHGRPSSVRGALRTRRRPGGHRRGHA